MALTLSLSSDSPKLATWLASLAVAVLGTSVLVWGQSTSSRLSRAVNELLANPDSALGPEVKELMRSGDSVARAIQEDRDITKLTRKQVEIVLYMLTSAFEIPASIAFAEDRSPRSTMRLLDDLKRYVNDAEQGSRIEDAALQIKRSLEQFKVTENATSPPSCRILFEVSSARGVLKFVHINMPNVIETYQADEQGKARLTLRPGHTQTYRFSAPGFQDLSITLSCVGTEYISRQVVMIRK